MAVAAIPTARKMIEAFIVDIIGFVMAEGGLEELRDGNGGGRCMIGMKEEDEGSRLRNSGRRGRGADLSTGSCRKNDGVKTRGVCN